MTDQASHDKLLIVDFGSQVTQLIARRVREAGVYCEIAPFQNADAAFRAMRPKAVILSGGPGSLPDAGSPRAPDIVFESGVPVLGICYGQMAMAAQLGGKVESGHDREFGRAEVETLADSPLFSGCWAAGEKTSWEPSVVARPRGKKVRPFTRERDPRRRARACVRPGWA